MALKSPAKLYRTGEKDRGASPGIDATMGPLVAFLLAVAASAGIAAYASRAISPEALLPILSIVLFASAAVLAMFGWRQRQMHSDRVTYWDVAGAVTLIGCAAAIMTEPENAMQVFGLRKN